jgi:hypothetical protein
LGVAFCHPEPGPELDSGSNDFGISVFAFKNLVFKAPPCGRGSLLIHLISVLEMALNNYKGQEFKFSFYYHPADHGVIKFKNQDQIVWTKEKK